MSRLQANIFRLQTLQLAFIISVGFLMNSLNPTATFAQYDMPPLASDDWQMTMYHTPIVINVLANDFGVGDPLDDSSVTIVSPAASGTTDVDPATGMILYTPNQKFSGYDEFSYTVADVAGNVSNPAIVSIWVENMAPSIELNILEYETNVWIISGMVWDENPAGCTVTFGGLLQGETTDVDEYGNYSLVKVLSSNSSGLITAEATDELGESSFLAMQELYDAPMPESYDDSSDAPLLAASSP